MRPSGCPGRWTAAMMALASAAASAIAQNGTVPVALKPVEQGVADIGPLGLSFRQMQVDLRKPLGFEQVFLVPGGPAAAPGLSAAPKFARASGALTAVFPKSDYVPVGGGVSLAAVPPDTRFVIGRLESTGTSAAAATPSMNSTAPWRIAGGGASHAADRRADRTADQRAVAWDEGDRTGAAPIAAEEPDTGGGMLGDERYRMERIGELLDRAVKGEAGEAAKPRPE